MEDTDSCLVEVRQTSIYPAIDLIHHALGSDPEYDFIVTPGADPTRIRLRYLGSQFSASGSGRVRHAMLLFHLAGQPPLAQVLSSRLRIHASLGRHYL